MTHSYSAFSHLVCIGHPASSRKRLFAMFTAYFDESGHHKDRDKIVTMGGIVVSEKSGRMLEHKWNRRLRRERKLQGKPFHATDFKARRDVFADLDDQEWNSLISDL